MLSIDYYDTNFFGMAGNDETAGKILSIVSSTPLKNCNYPAVITDQYGENWEDRGK